jgi:hypothetical protein
MDQLQTAINATQKRIAELESEVRREKEFLGRLIPASASIPGRRTRTSNHWLALMQAMQLKPMRHEHCVDFIEEHALPITRGAVRVGLAHRVQKGYLKRDKDGFYNVMPSGKEWLKKSSGVLP